MACFTRLDVLSLYGNTSLILTKLILLRPQIPYLGLAPRAPPAAFDVWIPKGAPQRDFWAVDSGGMEDLTAPM